MTKKIDRWKLLRSSIMSTGVILGALFLIALGIIFLMTLSFSCNKSKTETSPVDQAAVTARDYHPGTIRHIVMFKYKDGITAAQKQNVITAFMALKTQCTRNGTAYITDIEHGFPNSTEKSDQGMEIAFFVTFSSEGDRNYYVGTDHITDPAYFDASHDAFKKMVAPLLAASMGAIVYDYRKLP